MIFILARQLRLNLYSCNRLKHVVWCGSCQYSCTFVIRWLKPLVSGSWRFLSKFISLKTKHAVKHADEQMLRYGRAEEYNLVREYDNPSHLRRGKGSQMIVRPFICVIGWKLAKYRPSHICMHLPWDNINDEKNNPQCVVHCCNL